MRSTTSLRRSSVTARWRPTTGTPTTEAGARSAWRRSPAPTAISSTKWRSSSPSSPTRSQNSARPPTSRRRPTSPARVSTTRSSSPRERCDMRGSVVKKGGNWYVKIELDPDPGTGKRRQRWHSGYRTRRDAERARVDLLSRLDRGEYVEPSHQTLADFLADWLKAIEPTVRPSTFDSYSRNMRLHVTEHIGRVRLTKVDAGVLNGLYATLLSTGRRVSSRKGAGYSPA